VGDSPVCKITAAGISRPTLAACLAYWPAKLAAIWGQDLVDDSSAQDSEEYGLAGKVIDDFNTALVDAYNSFRPAYAQGVGLAAAVKLNGIAKKVPSFSTCDVMIVGQAFTTGADVIIVDKTGLRWTLAGSNAIPASGEVVATAICQTPGAVRIKAGDLFSFQTFILGWQRVSAYADSEPGQPVETDAMLRVRRAASTMTPATSILDAVVAQVFALPGVVDVRPYENDKDVADPNGQPGRSIALVVTGGVDQAIADAIRISKGPGTNTYGTTEVVSVDAYGVGRKIAFFRPTLRAVTFSIRLKALTGYTVDIAAAIAQSLSDWVTALPVGQSLLINRANVPANLNGAAAANAYEIVLLQAGVEAGTVSTADIPAAFTDKFACDPANVTVKVVLS
jgi:uncharacterized phage protein gp47/JayE